MLDEKTAHRRDPRLVIDFLKGADNVSARYSYDGHQGVASLTFEFFNSRDGRNDWSARVTADSFVLGMVYGNYKDEEGITPAWLEDPFLIRDYQNYFNELADKLIGEGWQNYAWFTAQKSNSSTS